MSVTWRGWDAVVDGPTVRFGLNGNFAPNDWVTPKPLDQSIRRVKVLRDSLVVTKGEEIHVFDAITLEPHGPVFHYHTLKPPKGLRDYLASRVGHWALKLALR